MDAGLAAVLGATVGAVGTGGASIVAALLSRSQTLMQVRAEHLRALREPRKGTYAAFAEQWSARFDLVTDGWIELELAAENRDSSEYTELMSNASRLRTEATNASGLVDRTQALVYVEGPESVTNTAIHAASALTTLAGHFHRSLVSVQNGEPLEDQAERYEALHADAHHKFLDFLYAAADTLGEDAISS